MLARDRMPTPNVLLGVDVVDAAEHLLVDSLHVIGLAEPIGHDFPIAFHHRRGCVRTVELVQVGPRARPRPRLRDIRSGVLPRDPSSRRPADPRCRRAPATALVHRCSAPRTHAATAPHATCHQGSTPSGDTGNAARSIRYLCPRRAGSRGADTRSERRAAGGRHPSR